MSGPVPRGRARAAILDAALQLIAQNGLDSLTHRRVAELAGVSPGSTTHHFSSRTDLVRAAFRRYLEHADRVLTSIDTGLRASVAQPMTRVTEFLVELVHREFVDRRYVRAEYEMFLFASTDPELGADLRTWEDKWVTYLVFDLRGAGAEEPEQTARALLNMVRGYELERLVAPDLTIEVLRERIRLLLEGVRIGV